MTPKRFEGPPGGWFKKKKVPIDRARLRSHARDIKGTLGAKFSGRKIMEKKHG
jgi:hypothetical protein